MSGKHRDTKKRVLMQVGPARQSGGIADVMRVIEAWAGSTGTVCITVNTSCNGPLVRRAAVGVAGVLRALLNLAVLPDPLVHVHMASNGSFLRKSVVVVAARARRRPVVLQIHGGGFVAFATGGTAMRERCVRHVLGSASIVLVLNETVQRAMRALQPQTPVEIIHNPATLVCGNSTDPTSRRVLFLGRLGRIKGTDVLLDAIRILQTDGVDADYVLAGDGDVDAVRATVSTLPNPQRVQVPGWVDANDVHRLLHTCSVYCLPSRYEGLPMALLQAMGHGLACVVTPVGGMADIMVNGVNGRVVPVGDSHRLAEALGDLLAHAERRAALGEGAAETIRSGYSVEKVMRDLERIYTAVSAAEARDARA